MNIWTFLEITSWKIELPQVNQAWSLAAASIKIDEAFYKTNLELQKKGAEIFDARLCLRPSVGDVTVFTTPGFLFRRITVVPKDGRALRLYPTWTRIDQKAVPGHLECANCRGRRDLREVPVVAINGKEAWNWLNQTRVVQFDHSDGDNAWESYHFVVLCVPCLSIQSSDQASDSCCIRKFVIVRGVKLCLMDSPFDF